MIRDGLGLKTGIKKDFPAILSIDDPEGSIRRENMRRQGLRDLCINGLSVLLTCFAVFGWWGALYPEFTLLTGTYEVVYEEADQKESGKETGQKESPAETEDKDVLYWQIMGADQSQIRLKSRLLEDWKAWKKAGSESYESEE